MSLFDREKQIETYFIRRVKMAGALNRKIQYVMINCPGYSRPSMNGWPP